MAPSTLYLQIQEVLKVSKKCNSAHNYQMQCNNYRKKERNFESLSRKKRFVSPVFHGVIHQVRPCLNFAGYNATNQSKWTEGKFPLSRLQSTIVLSTVWRKSG